jgi:DNA-binding transcriptional LysR family regulator
MARKIDWESQIGRRLKLRDLHVFVTIVQRGSMAKAAEHLGVSQPAVSEIIADLEHAVGVRLLDRGPQGVTPTMYGQEMIERSRAAFDELKQGITASRLWPIRLSEQSGSDARSLSCPQSCRR